MKTLIFALFCTTYVFAFGLGDPTFIPMNQITDEEKVEEQPLRDSAAQDQEEIQKEVEEEETQIDDYRFDVPTSDETSETGDSDD